MKFIKLPVLMLISSWAFAGTTTIYDAKVTSINFWGDGQATVYFDKSHGLICGGNASHVNAIAFNPTTAGGKTKLAAFMMAYSANKTVTVSVTNNVCNGDRSTIHNTFTIGD